jgi:hypothetical protein
MPWGGGAGPRKTADDPKKVKPDDTSPGFSTKYNPYGKAKKGESSSEKSDRQKKYYSFQRKHAEETGDQKTVDKIYGKMGKPSRNVDADAVNKEIIGQVANPFNRLKLAGRAFQYLGRARPVAKALTGGTMRKAKIVQEALPQSRRALTGAREAGAASKAAPRAAGSASKAAAKPASLAAGSASKAAAKPASLAAGSASKAASKAAPRAAGSASKAAAKPASRAAGSASKAASKAAPRAAGSASKAASKAAPRAAGSASKAAAKPAPRAAGSASKAASKAAPRVGKATASKYTGRKAATSKKKR